MPNRFWHCLIRVVILIGMSDVTSILVRIETGDAKAAGELLVLVYDELRKLAAAKLAREKPGQTLQATGLVHEAYLRLVGPANLNGFANRSHFFSAAAEAMRRILTDAARHKKTAKHGGDVRRVTMELEELGGDSPADPTETLAVHELLDRLASRHRRKAEVVKLRYFLGCTQEEAAQILGITPAAAQEDWVFARAWLKREWKKGEAV